MTNEELVALIQGGDRNKLMDLWAQVRGMALKEAHRWASYRSGGVELEDLEQAGFIALMVAVDRFDPSKGNKFSTVYYPIMRGEFTWTVGRKTSKQAQDPLNTAVSLDVQVGEDEGGATAGELLPDPMAVQAFENVEERERQAQLHTILLNAISTLASKQRAAVIAQYWHGDMASNQRSNLHLAMQALRRPRVSRQLREFL